MHSRKHKIALTTFLALLMSLSPFPKTPKTQAYYGKTKTLKVGKASWYSRHSPGIKKHTANNEIFDDESMTCAMWGVPFNQKLRITNRKTGKSIIVRVNDRGPHKRYVVTGRVVDLTQEAFSKLAPNKKGLIEVEIEFL